jgi:hypothetical protein
MLKSCSRCCGVSAVAGWVGAVWAAGFDVLVGPAAGLVLGCAFCFLGVCAAGLCLDMKTGECDEDSPGESEDDLAGADDCGDLLPIGDARDDGGDG